MDLRDLSSELYDEATQRRLAFPQPLNPPPSDVVDGGAALGSAHQQLAALGDDLRNVQSNTFDPMTAWIVRLRDAAQVHLRKEHNTARAAIVSEAMDRKIDPDNALYMAMKDSTSDFFRARSADADFSPSAQWLADTLQQWGRSPAMKAELAQVTEALRGDGTDVDRVVLGDHLDALVGGGDGTDQPAGAGGSSDRKARCDTAMLLFSAFPDTAVLAPSIPKRIAALETDIAQRERNVDSWKDHDRNARATREKVASVPDPMAQRLFETVRSAVGGPYTSVSARAQVRKLRKQARGGDSAASIELAAAYASGRMVDGAVFVQDAAAARAWLDTAVPPVDDKLRDAVRKGHGKGASLLEDLADIVEATPNFHRYLPIPVSVGLMKAGAALAVKAADGGNRDALRSLRRRADAVKRKGRFLCWKGWASEQEKQTVNRAVERATLSLIAYEHPELKPLCRRIERAQNHHERTANLETLLEHRVRVGPRTLSEDEVDDRDELRSMLTASRDVQSSALMCRANALTGFDPEAFGSEALNSATPLRVDEMQTAAQMYVDATRLGSTTAPEILAYWGHKTKSETSQGVLCPNDATRERETLVVATNEAALCLLRRHSITEDPSRDLERAMGPDGSPQTRLSTLKRIDRICDRENRIRDSTPIEWPVLSMLESMLDRARKEVSSGRVEEALWSRTLDGATPGRVKEVQIAPRASQLDRLAQRAQATAQRPSAVAVPSRGRSASATATAWASQGDPDDVAPARADSPGVVRTTAPPPGAVI